MPQLCVTNVPRKSGTLNFMRLITRHTIEPFAAVISRRITGNDGSNVAVAARVGMHQLIPVSDTAALLLLRCELSENFQSIQVVFVQEDWTCSRIEWRHLVTFDPRGALDKLPREDFCKDFYLQPYTGVSKSDDGKYTTVKVKLIWSIKGALAKKNSGPGHFDIGSWNVHIAERSPAGLEGNLRRPAVYEADVPI